MLLSAAIAPSYEILRPTLLHEPGTVFPVYEHLVDDLVGASGLPDPTVQHALAVASGYAYSDAATMTEMMARMGMEKNRCLQASMTVEPMFIDSCAYVVQSHDGRVVIVAYRGTELSKVVSWLTDADAHPDQIAFPFPGARQPYPIHAGFYRNVRATRYVVVDALKRAARGWPVVETDPASADGICRPTTVVDEDARGPLEPMTALYVTGHSLGGAMAALLSVMLAVEPQYVDRFSDVFRGACTFGQPMVGAPDFAKACTADEFLRERVVRYVYEKDPVPHLPPRLVGRYAHFGREWRFDEPRGWQNTSGSPIAQEHGLGSLLTAPLTFAARQIPVLERLPFEYSADDHAPHHYISALTPQGVPNEFGDAELFRGDDGAHPVPGT